MEFKIPVMDMQSVISRMSSIVKLNEDDLTSMILIEVGKDVKFRCSNASITAVITSDQCEVISKGKALIKFKDIKGYILKFTPLADNYGTENFHFIADKDQSLIKTKTQFPSGKSSYRRLKFDLFNDAFSIKNYTMPKPFDVEKTQLIINSDILKRSVAKVLHCVNPAEIRKALTGLSVVVKNNKVIFTGTDGVKLTEFITDINTELEQDLNIFNYGFSSILYNILDNDAQVFMKFENDCIYIISNDIYIIGGLIIGEDYPNYKPMFELQKSINFPRVDFIDSDLAVMDVLDEEDNHRLTINVNDNKLVFKNDRVEALHEFDDPFEFNLDIDINGEFLASILKDFVGDVLEVHFMEENNYVVFKSADNDNHTALLTVVKRR